MINACYHGYIIVWLIVITLVMLIVILVNDDSSGSESPAMAFGVALGYALFQLSVVTPQR